MHVLSCHTHENLSSMPDPTPPIITLFILGTPLKTTHLQKHA